MKNYVSDGDIVTVVAPAGGVITSQGVLIGAMFGVAESTAAEGDPVAVFVEGIVDLPKAAGAIAAGAKIYWDDTAKLVTTDPGTAPAPANTAIGVATLAALTADVLARVRLNGSF